MKKLLLLPVLVFFAACSTDDNDLNIAQENELTNAQYRAAAAEDPSCLTSVSASVSIDVSRGIDHPYAVFTGNMTGASNKATYKARVEVEMLSDCEDITSGNGVVTIFAMPGTIQNPLFGTATISVAGNLLPANPCYRWRFVIDGTVAGSKSKNGCSVASPWYDAPLF